MTNFDSRYGWNEVNTRDDIESAGDISSAPIIVDISSASSVIGGEDFNQQQVLVRRVRGNVACTLEDGDSNVYFEAKEVPFDTPGLQIQLPVGTDLHVNGSETSDANIAVQYVVLNRLNRSGGVNA